MNIMIRDIFQFNRDVLKLPAPSEPRLLDEKTLKISVKCLREEVEELETAHEVIDYVGAVDAVLDNIYFAVGILYKLGLTEDQVDRCMETVHSCNMRKKLGINAKRDTGAADAVKPSDWEGPEERIARIIGE